MPTFTYQAVDATPTGDDGATAGTLRVVPMRLQKGSFVRTGKEFQVPLTVVNYPVYAEDAEEGDEPIDTEPRAQAVLVLEVTAPGEAYKVVESFTGGNGSGYWVVVKEGDTEWADLEIVSQPGTSLPTAIWEANLVSLRARVDQVEGVAEGSAEAVGELAEVVAGKASQTDLTALATTIGTKASASSVTALASTVTSVSGVANAALPSATAAQVYSPAFAPLNSIAYNPDGTVAATVEGGITTAFTWNPDGTVATETRLGLRRTWSYSPTLSSTVEAV